MSSFVLREHVTVLLEHGRGRVSIEKDRNGWWETFVTDKVTGRRYSVPAVTWKHAVDIGNEIASNWRDAFYYSWEERGDAGV